MSVRRTILVVDDDPATLHVLQSGLTTALDDADVLAAASGREALEFLESRTIDVLVTDLSMPVLDGFPLIAAVSNRFSSLPVVVLSGMSTRDLEARLSRHRGLRVLPKPATHRDVAEAVVDALERVELGQVEGLPLTAILQLVESERRSCVVLITSGRRKGRLYFQSGQLVNAFSEDFAAEGEAAAHDILGWDDPVVEFGHLPDDVRRLIDTPMQLMLIDLAVQQDQAGRMVAAADEEGDMSFGDDRTHHPDRASDAVDGSPDAPAAALETSPPPSIPEPDAAAPPALDPHAARLLEAMGRLAERVAAADEALAAVGDEVAAFREAHRLFDEVAAARERRRVELEAFRADVSRLAREILGRVDGLFDEPPSTLPNTEAERVADEAHA